MLLQRLKKYRRLYLLAVVLFAISLMVIFFHRHANNQSRVTCPICKIAKDISSSKVLEPFCPLIREMVAALDPIEIFSPVAISLLLTQDSRASPLHGSFLKHRS